MAIEGMDSAMPIETAGFVPQVGIAEAAEAGPTLDAALAQAQRTAREAMAAPDLWVEDPAGPYRPHAGVSHANPVAGMFLDSPAPSAADDPLILHKLTIDDMTWASAGGRNGDSTEDDPTEDDGPPIIVVGPPPYDWSYWDEHPFEPEDNDSNPDGWGNGGGGGGGDPQDPSSDPYADRVVIDPSVPPEYHDRAVAVDQKLTAEMREFGAKINSLADNQLYNFEGKTFTGAELKEVFSHLSFNITFGRDYGPGGMGANDNGVVSNNLGYLEGLLAQNHDWGDWGTNWLILHEISHLLGFERDFEHEKWLQYLATDPTPTTAEWQGTQYFRDVEDLTNQVAYFLGELFGTPIGPYEPIPIPPPGGGGPGGDTSPDDGPWNTGYQ